MMDEQYQDEEEEGENERAFDNGGGVDISATVGRFYGWPSSRIVRVSRACGGKDRHSKVLTSKGLRDRRVRLSVNTAIQFYDLQDRLGYDQPSKAVEWLLKAAATSINELPPMSILFPGTMKQLSEEKRSNSGGGDQLGFDSPEVEMEDGGGDPSYSQNVAIKSSICSAASETSKGSGLSLSRSGTRIKARERAYERVVEKEKENGSLKASSLNPISETTSFTELLNGGISHIHNCGSGAANGSNFFMKSPKDWSSTPMDYFSGGLLTPVSGRAGQIPLTSNFTSMTSGFGVAAADHHQSLQQFSYAPDNLVQVINSSNMNPNHNESNEYNMRRSFSLSSSGLAAGFNRGTLQSNSSSPSLLPHIQRFPDGSPPSFFIGSDAPVDNNAQFLDGYEARLQLYYGDAHANSGSKYSSQKVRGNN